MSKNVQDLEKLAKLAEVLGIDLDFFGKSEDEAQEAYNEWLDETNKHPEVCGCSMLPSKFLKQEDPTAYDVGFVDWLDTSEFTEHGGLYFTEETITELKQEITDQVEGL
jgi:transcriptional regulator with XRE-family HTH domain